MERNPANYQGQFDLSDFVIAAEPDSPDAAPIYPSTEIQAQTLAMLRARGDYKLVATCPGLANKMYFVYQKAPPFQGWGLMEGLGPVEGPYPQWQLPVVRWGVGRSTLLTTHAATTGTQRLCISCDSQLPDQRMTIKLDGRTIVTESFPRPNVFLDFEYPLQLTEGDHRIDLEYARSSETDAGRAVLFQRLSLIP